MTKYKLEPKMIIAELVKQKINLEEENKELKMKLNDCERRLATCQR